MKSLLTVLALAIALGVGYWKFRGTDALEATHAGTVGSPAGLLPALFSRKATDTSQLESDLAASQEQLATTNATLENNSLALQDTQQQLADTQSRLGSTETLIEELLNQVAFASSAQATAKGQLEKLRQQIETSGASQASTAEAMDAKIEKLASNLSEMDTSFASSTQTLSRQINDTVSQQLASQKNAIDKLEAEFDTRALQASVQTNASQIASLEQKLENAVNDATTSEQFNSLQSSVTELDQTVVGMQEQLGGTESSVLNQVQSRLDETVAELDAEFDSNRKTDTENQARLLRQSVNRLENQIKAVSATSGEAQAAVELSNAVDQRIDEVENAVAAIDQSAVVQQMSQQMSEQDQRIDGLDQSVAGLDQSIGGLDQKLGTIEESVGGLESGLESSLLEKVNADTQSMQEQLDLARKKVAVLEASIGQLPDTSGIEPQLTALSGRIDSLESSGNDLAAALPKMEALQQSSFSANQGQELSTKVEELEVALANLDDTVVAIRSTAAQAAVGESEAIGVSQNRIQEQLSQLESKVSGTASPTDLSAVEDQLAQSRQRIEQLEERLNGLSGSSVETAGAEQIQSQLQSQIAALEKRLAEEANKPDLQLASALDAVRKKVSVLEEQGKAAKASSTVVRGKPNEYKIYFGKDSSNISGDAEKVLNSFIAQEQNRAKSVSIFGFTDRSGNAAYNQRLALRRANRVRSFLIQQGFDFRKINAVDGLGEDPAATKLDDGQEDANQRTVVLYAHQK